MAKKASKEEEAEEESDGEEEEESKYYSRYDDPPRKPRKHAGGSVNIAEPMSIWVVLLFLAVLSRFVLQSTSIVPSGNFIYSILTIFPSFMLAMPGILVLPMIVGAVIGAEVGSRSMGMDSAIKSGFLNGIYATVVYAVIITVVYIILDYITPQAAFSIYSLVQNSIVLPAVVLLVMVEAFAMLAYSRKVDQ